MTCIIYIEHKEICNLIFKRPKYILYNFTTGPTTSNLNLRYMLFYQFIQNYNIDRPCVHSDWSKTQVSSKYKTEKKRVSLFFTTWRGLSRVLHCHKTLRTFETIEKWEHSTAAHVPTLSLCSQMPVAFYHSVIHGLHVGFFTC